MYSAAYPRVSIMAARRKAIGVEPRGGAPKCLCQGSTRRHQGGVGDVNDECLQKRGPWTNVGKDGHVGAGGAEAFLPEVGIGMWVWMRMWMWLSWAMSLLQACRLKNIKGGGCMAAWLHDTDIHSLALGLTANKVSAFLFG